MTCEKLHTGKLFFEDGGSFGKCWKIKNPLRKNIFVKNETGLAEKDIGKSVKFILQTIYQGRDYGGDVTIDYGIITKTN